MYNNNAIEGTLFAILASAVVGVIIISSTSVGSDEGKNEGIVYCIEQPKECKTTYDYLKLRENQK